MHWMIEVCQSGKNTRQTPVYIQNNIKNNFNIKFNGIKKKVFRISPVPFSSAKQALQTDNKTAHIPHRQRQELQS